MGRLTQIDGLRAVAVLLVMGRHLHPPDEGFPDWLQSFLDTWNRGGWVGVDLFFVLSGFLVSGLLFHEFAKNGDLKIGRFLIRRGFKIYPAFWVMIGTTLLYDWWVTEVQRYRAALGEILFVQNYWERLWSHTWSLAVEEHFYFLLALLIALLVRRGNDPFRRIPVIFGTLAVGSLLLRLVASFETFSEANNVFPSLLRLDSLFAGVLLSHLFHSRRGQFTEIVTRRRAALLASGGLLLLPAFLVPLETWWVYTFGFIAFYVGSSAILAGTLALPASKSPVMRWIAYLGAHSYSIYLWHMPVETWLASPILEANPSPAGWALYFVVYFGVSAALGIVMGKLIEVPAIRVRDRWFPTAARSSQNQSIIIAHPRRSNSVAVCSSVAPLTSD